MTVPSSLEDRVASAIPARAGIGLRAQHYREVVQTQPAIGWFEVHSENYFGAGGPPLGFLAQVRRDYPLSLHGVGLSLGGTDPLDMTHLQKLKSLITRFAPGLISEHLCWSSIGGIHLNDLLPLPYTEEALQHVSGRIRRTQDYLQQEILIENVSSYLQYHHSTLAEEEFLAEVAARAGCGILLDINNIYVNAVNHGFDPHAYLRAIPVTAVREMHLAGFAVNHYDEGDILIDHHGAPVAQPVWDLYREALERFGPIPTLIEWDTDIPPLSVLLQEARTAETLLERRHARVA